MLLSLVTPERKLLSRLEVEEIFVPASRGELNILPGHAPMMTTLEEGDFRYRVAGETELRHVAISWGFCEVEPEGVHILAETAELPEEIDLERVEKTRLNAEKMILSENVDAFMREKYTNKIKRAGVRADVAGFKKNN